MGSPLVVSTLRCWVSFKWKFEACRWGFYQGCGIYWGKKGFKPSTSGIFTPANSLWQGWSAGFEPPCQVETGHHRVGDQTFEIMNPNKHECEEWKIYQEVGTLLKCHIVTFCSWFNRPFHLPELAEDIQVRWQSWPALGLGLVRHMWCPITIHVPLIILVYL